MNLPLNTSANISDPVAQARYNMIEQQIRPWNVLDADVLTEDEMGKPADQDSVYARPNAVHQYGLTGAIQQSVQRMSALVRANQVELR